MVSEEEKYLFMQQALQLGERGRFKAPPNPWVGCLIVQQGAIVGQGYTQPFGQSHAEIGALEEAKEKARGATAYISLEPCAHWGKTGPCTAALIKAGIRRVVIPMLDPDSQVLGRGVKQLLDAGIEVEVGILEKEARELLAPYLYHRSTGLPFCVLKVATSIDGKLAAPDGSSHWITGDEARKDAHLLRAQSQAILIGSMTALKDLPQLTVRNIEGDYNQPLRIVLDRQGCMKPVGPLFDISLAPTLIFTCNEAGREWETYGVEVIVNKDISIKNVLIELGRRGVMQLLVEGGAKIHSAFLEKGYCQRLIVYVGGVILGAGGIDIFSEINIPSMKEAKRIKLLQVQRFGNDIKMVYNV
jgi:diaminohydroxyphosphoribosylaminopyrimidine deaminase/5-amino-6-(5-phosphoribosylamino)uracil reductase